MELSIDEIKKVHSKSIGKLSINSTVKIDSKEVLSKVYTPGVAQISNLISEDESLAKQFTIAGKMVAVISDGSAVLGLGNIGAKGALPVMEGKCAIFKEFAGVDAFPICLATQDTEEIISTIKAISPNFAAINLEDISAPRCFEIEERLSKELQIPVMHDDQHGTAIVTLAALKSALRLVPKEKVNIVISGAGAAGSAITKLLLTTKTILDLKISQIKVLDSKGVVTTSRDDIKEDDPKTKDKYHLAQITKQSVNQSMSEALIGADVFIGVSAPEILSSEMVKSMNLDPIIFALANPVPEIMPAIAYSAGASIVATGRSDFPNQINNALAYPGVFKGLIQNGIRVVTDEIKLKAAENIFKYHLESGALSADNILPSILDKEVPKLIANSI